jgi:hypothetical protein
MYLRVLPPGSVSSRLALAAGLSFSLSRAFKTSEAIQFNQQFI